jgi:hypothetical protein
MELLDKYLSIDQEVRTNHQELKSTFHLIGIHLDLFFLRFQEVCDVSRYYLSINLIVVNSGINITEKN